MLQPVVMLIVGAGLGLLGNRAHWRREDRLRWVGERRASYGAFLSALDRWEELDYEAAVNGEIEEWFEAPPEDRMEPLLGVRVSTRLRPRVNEAAAKTRELLAELDLIGSRLVHGRAESAVARMRLLSDVRLTSPPRACGGCSEEHNEAQTAYQDRREQYVEAVRAELGVG